MLEPAPGVEVGRYVLVGRPERYGAGSLVGARELRSGARRSLWLVLPEVVAVPEHRARVVRVATAVRKVESPHLLRVHEFGEEDGQPFFATAPLDGVDLARVCSPDGIPPEDALDLVAQIGAGVNQLHHAGVVDAALGPLRVLVEERDGKAHAAVVHAGVLATLLPTSALFGSLKQEALDYGAPELQLGEEPTVRSDVYSLGCLLWLALTGQQPHDSYVGHRSGTPLQVEGDGPVEQAVNSILQRALAQDPAQRYRDAAAFAATVRSVAALAREGAAGELPERLVPRGPAAWAAPALAAAVVEAPVVDAPGEEALAVGAPLVAPSPPAGRHAGPTPLAPGPDAIGLPLFDGAEPERALQAAADHWASGRPVSRAGRTRRRTKRALQAGTVAAGLGAVAVVGVWGARHLELVDAAPSEVATRPPVVIPTSTAEVLDPLERLVPLAAAGACVFDPAQVAHRIERWTCQRTGFRVVLTHWDSLASARAFVPHGGEEGAREPWRLEGARAGTQWTWRAAGGARTFRWTGIYSDIPYAVVIEAKDKARRRFAREHVVIHPSTVLG